MVHNHVIGIGHPAVLGGSAALCLAQLCFSIVTER